MALDELQGVIERLQDRIEAHHDYLSRHETRTRQVLIDPLLQELGWDVSDPEDVQLEYRVGQQWADYALMYSGQPVAVIEAKRLGRGLEDDEIMQVLNYANRDGIDYMIVTDGDHWEMYEVFKKGTLEERLLMKFQLSQQLPHKNVLQALGMWKPNLVSDGSTAKTTELTVVPPKPAPDQPNNESNERQPQPSFDDSPKDRDFDQWYSLVSERRYPMFTKPIQLKIGADIEKSVTSWKTVVYEIVAWLIDTEKLTDNHFPIGMKENIFISREAVNRDGTPFQDPQQLPKGLILDRHRGRPWDQWERLRELLDQFQVDTSMIQVSYEPIRKASR